MRLRRRPGWPIAPHMDEVYVDLHLLTELVLAMCAEDDHWPRRTQRVADLCEQLRDRLEAQKKEIEYGLPP